MNQIKEKLPALKTFGRQVVDPQGNEVRLRGVSLGPWLSMDFGMHGLPGSNWMLRLMAEEQAGQEKADVFFRCMEENFITEDDIAYISRLGANVVWVPLDYRHFFQDSVPMKKREYGFEKLDQLLCWCETHQIYCIPELHAAPGGQSAGRDSGRAGGEALLFQDGFYQDAFLTFWEALACRYRGKSCIAAFSLLNAPATSDRFGRVPLKREKDWDSLNELYDRTVSSLKGIDPERILILDGDDLGQSFFGLSAPFSDGLAYACSLHTSAEQLPFYPGMDAEGQYWERERVRDEFFQTESVKFCTKHSVPLFVKRFGVRSYPDFTCDQISAFEDWGAHWAFDSYKDCGYWALLRYAPDCSCLKKFGDIMRRFGTEGYAQHGCPVTGPRREMEKRFKDFQDSLIAASGNDELLPSKRMLSSWIDDVYYSKILAFEFAKRLAETPTEELERQIAESFALSACVKTPLLQMVRGCWGHQDERSVRQ